MIMTTLKYLALLLATVFVLESPILVSIILSAIKYGVMLIGIFVIGFIGSARLNIW